MQVLFTLILTYNIYFGCLICETLRFPKLYTVGAFTITPSRNCVILPITGSDNGPKSNESDHYWDTCVDSRYHSIQQFATNNSAEIKTEKLIWKRCYCKIAKRGLRSYFRKVNTNRMHRRKLLGYEQDFHERIPKHHKSRGIHGEMTTKKSRLITRKERDVAARKTEMNDDDIDSEKWDDWSNWSACSVTCGQGQQVRWRHCTSKDCVKGLKKAQLKSCRLKDCARKGFLGFEETTLQMMKLSLDINSAPIENSTLEIKSNKFRRKAYSVDYNIDNNHKNDNMQTESVRRNYRDPKIWDQWGNWSTCSATCGIGKIVRWRHCIAGSCSRGEKKAQLRTCTSAAC